MDMVSGTRIEAEWSTLLPNQSLQSPEKSSSPVSTSNRISQSDLQKSIEDKHGEEGPPSPSNTPTNDDQLNFDGNLRGSQPTQTSRRKSPPAWLADANVKLNAALPSFFPQPDALKSALERVRNQKPESPVPAEQASFSAASFNRRPLPTFDVEEAKRIAKIFSSYKDK